MMFRSSSVPPPVTQPTHNRMILLHYGCYISCFRGLTTPQICAFTFLYVLHCVHYPILFVWKHSYLTHMHSYLLGQVQQRQWIGSGLHHRSMSPSSPTTPFKKKRTLSRGYPAPTWFDRGIARKWSDSAKLLQAGSQRQRVA